MKNFSAIRTLRNLLAIIIVVVALLLMLLIQPFTRLQTTSGFELATHSTEHSVIIAIWNLHNQKNYFENDNQAAIVQQFHDTSLSASDVISLQEVKNKSTMTELASQFNYQLTGGRNALLARYPVINQGIVSAESKGETAFWSDIQIKDTLLRVYSVHLSFKQQGSAFIAAVRGDEVQQIIHHASDFNGPVIISGDFNTLSLFSPDFSQIPVFSNLKAAGYQSARPLGACDSQIPLGEQDWIFYKNARALRYVCGNYAGSDHRWIQAEIELP